MQATLHHLMTVWFQFTLEWGYLGIVLMMALESTAVPIPAEIVVPPAAYWASQGKFSIVGVVLAATLGSWIGSAISYWVAWKLGRPLFDRYGKFAMMGPQKIQHAEHWFDTYGAGGIFVARLLPGIRHVISIPAGLFRMNFKVFSLMTIAGAGFFCAILAWFGQKVIGDQPQLMNDPAALVSALHEKKWWIVGFALTIAVLYALTMVLQKRASERKSLSS
ncbi:MAG TPA: DedA family protein [Thermoanaerobaculia bacterium]|nr:DedA family protein [Thermoanaerobaculia bacterium]